MASAEPSRKFCSCSRYSRAEAHRLGDRRFIDARARNQHRHLRRILLFDLHDGSEIDAELVNECDQHLGIDLRECIAQVPGVGQPGAMHRMAGLAQRAVDRFDVVLRPRHDDHRNGPLFGHLQ
jgi:hypothetical protein